MFYNYSRHARISTSGNFYFIEITFNSGSEFILNTKFQTNSNTKFYSEQNFKKCLSKYKNHYFLTIQNMYNIYLIYLIKQLCNLEISGW